MAHTWKYAVLLGLVGTAMAAGCTVKEGDDDDIGGFGGDAGDDAGTGGTTGGTSGKGGTGGTAGKGGSSGSGGTAGKGGTSGTGGTTAGTGGSAGDDAGEGGAAGEAPDTTPQCDPSDGDLDSEPYPNCEASDADDECQVCVEESCCEESKRCYGLEPYNVCGWGGPDAEGEIVCYQRCLAEYVSGNDDICDPDGIDECVAECVTEGCDTSLLGNQTQDLSVCMHTNCSEECFGADSCD